MKTPIRGSGAFQWNVGGWFGGQVGSTLWLLILGVLLCFRGHVVAGLVALGCFAAANLFGTVLWTLRHRVAPFPAIECLLGVIFLFTIVALVAMDVLGVMQEIDPRMASSAWGLYWVLAVFPGLMLMMYLMERANRKKD